MTRRLAFFASHNGSNMQAVVRACEQGRLDAVAAVVVGNNAGSVALRFAAEHGIPAVKLNGRTHPEPDDLDAAICDALVAHDVELVVLAGYMKKLGPRTLARYDGRIINIHPALLPQFGGQGMWGSHVHGAVLAAGVAHTGVTVHLVDAEYDAGAILAQTRVAVQAGDDATTLQTRVQAREHEFLVETVAAILAGDIALPAPD